MRIELTTPWGSELNICVVMSKRFIDTGFLDQKWIRKLSSEKKIFLIYLMLKCDNGGIIDLDFEDASFWIGKKINDLNFLPESYLIPLNNLGKYFMPKFIEWQYKDLSSNKFIVAQARQILEKHELINSDFTLNLPNSYIKVIKDVPNNQEQGIGIGIGIGKGIGKEKIPFSQFWDLYNRKEGAKNKCELKWNKLNNETRQKIINTLPIFLSKIKDRQFQPYPETYLNQERWNDEITEPVYEDPVEKTMRELKESRERDKKHGN